MDLGRKIINTRLDRRMNQEMLAKAAGITSGALSRIESGKANPRSWVLLQVSRALGVTAEYLLDETQPYPYRPHPVQEDVKADTTEVSMVVTQQERKLIGVLRQLDEVRRELVLALPGLNQHELLAVFLLVFRPAKKTKKRKKTGKKSAARSSASQRRKK